MDTRGKANKKSEEDVSSLSYLPRRCHATRMIGFNQSGCSWQSAEVSDEACICRRSEVCAVWYSNNSSRSDIQNVRLQQNFVVFPLSCCSCHRVQCQCDECAEIVVPASCTGYRGKHSVVGKVPRKGESFVLPWCCRVVL